MVVAMSSVSTIVSLIGMGVVFLPGLLVGVLLMWAIGRNRVAAVQGKPAPYPIHFNPTEFVKAVSAAFTGNVDAMKIAFDKAVDIQFKQGDRVAWVMDAVLDEIAARIKNPSVPMPAFDAVALWSGVPRDVLFAMGEHELRSRKVELPPATTPASVPVIPLTATAIAIALCLCFTGSTSAAYPLGPSFGQTWGQEVKGPQRFYERDGWTTQGTRRAETVWGVVVDELEYRCRL